DVLDPAFREGLTSAEAALDEGDYMQSVERSAGVYQQLIAQRPEVIVLPPDFSKLAISSRPPLGARRGPWPSHFGVQLQLGGPRPLAKPTHPAVRLVEQAPARTVDVAGFEHLHHERAVPIRQLRHAAQAHFDWPRQGVTDLLLDQLQRRVRWSIAERDVRRQ